MYLTKPISNYLKITPHEMPALRVLNFVNVFLVLLYRFTNHFLGWAFFKFNESAVVT